MNIIRMVAVLGVLFGLLESVGCTRSTGLYGERTGNTIAYGGIDTGHRVAYTLGGEYVYEKAVDRPFMGIDIRGHLFMAPDGSRVLVAKMPRAEFEDLIGYPIKAPTWGVKAYPPRTVWLERLCQLSRAYVVTLDKDVTTAIKLLSFKDKDGNCTREWLSHKDILSDNPALLPRFNESADRSIAVDWQ